MEALKFEICKIVVGRRWVGGVEEGVYFVDLGDLFRMSSEFLDAERKKAAREGDIHLNI